MGDPFIAEGDTDERPRHSVYVDEFFMDRHEVTNQQYALCVDAGACVPPSERGSFSRSAYYGNIVAIFFSHGTLLLII